MKKLTKTAALILSTLMLFGCTDNSTQSGVGDTTPPSESSVTESKTDSKNENSVTENSSVTDNSSKESEEKGRFIRRERRSGSFSRSFYVGSGVEETDISASYENGTLKVTFPTEAQARKNSARSIEIK